MTKRIFRSVFLTAFAVMLACIALIVGALMTLVYLPGEVTYLAGAAYVGAGQAIACYGLGMPLLYVLERYGGKLFRD